MIKKIFLLVICLLSLFLFSKTRTFAQYYCSGGATCEEQGFERVCNNNGKFCSNNQDCGLNGRCIQRAIIVGTDQGICIASGGGCHASCPRGGFVQASCGTRYYPSNPSTPTPRPTTPGVTPNPSDPPGDPIGYGCDTCSGTCREGGSSTIQACQSSCTIDLSSCTDCPPEDPECNDGGGDPNAGQSSCPEIEEGTTSVIIKPGETRVWNTWATPPGSTAEQRLQTASPGLTTVSYTSPGNMITAAVMFRVVESEPHSFYIYDDVTKTFYFLQYEYKPAVIFSRSQEVVDKAIALGYTLVDPDQTSPTTARDLYKRVYKLRDNGNPWKEGSTKLPVAHHLPYGQTLYHIPYVSCASLINASGNTRYYSTTYPLQGLHCFKREARPLRFPKDDPDDEYTEMVMMGNYLGMEQDWPRSSWVALSGKQAGSQVWPRTNLYVNRDLYKYGPSLKFAALQKGSYSPGFLRQAILQIPAELVSTQVIDGSEIMSFYAFIGMGDPGNSTPAQDQNSSQGCLIETKDDICDPNEDWKCKMPEQFADQPAKCENLRLVHKNTGQIVNPGGKVKRGETYTITSNAKNHTRLYNFYNNSFNDPKVTSSQIDNWTKSEGINDFQIVDCGSNCIPENGGDTKVLRASQLASANQAANGLHSTYVDTGENVTGKTFQVEFWARVDGSPKILPQILVERDRYVPITSSDKFEPIIEPSDTRELRFPVPNTANATQPSITVTNEWQKFIGTVTYNYDTTNPTGHPRGSIASKLKLILKTPADGTRIYYDDIYIVGWYQPNVYYRMASALTPAQNPNYNQCSLSIHSGPTYTNLSGGLFWSDLTIPQDRAPGKYNVFAAMEVAPGKVLFGNPNATNNCGLNRNNWDDILADTCRMEVDLIACNDVTPQVPTVTSVNGNNNTLPNVPTNPIGTRFNDFRITDGQLRIIAQAGGSPQQQEATTGMIMFVESYSSENQSQPSDGLLAINGTPIGQNSFLFVYNINQQDTNELSIYIQSINENACNQTGELSSNWYKRNIRLMRQQSGRVIELTRAQFNNQSFNCKTTAATINSTGQGTVVNVGESRFSGMNMIINTNGTFGSYTVNDTPDVSAFKGFFRSSIGNLFRTDVPYNPTNIPAWRNQITTAVLQFPQMTEEDSYVCHRNCNPGSIVNSRLNCTIPGTRIPNDQPNASSDDLNVYVTKGNFNDPWWQTRGGLVFAQGTISSSLPIFNGSPRRLCQEVMGIDVCQPFINAKRLNISSPANNTVHASAGLSISNSNSISAPASYITQKNPSSQQVPNAATAPNLETYSYLRGLAKENSKVKSDLPNVLSGKPSGADDYDPGTENVRVYERIGNLHINLEGSTFSVGANEKIIIYVTENLTIGGSDTQDTVGKITVAPGGFLAFIVQGNINIDSTIGTNIVTETRPAIEGVYFAGGTLTIQSAGPAVKDKKFIGRGSFIGLGGVNLQRKFNSTTDIFDEENNSRSPIEQFIFSPSLVAATPNLLREADLTWKETN